MQLQQMSLAESAVRAGTTVFVGGADVPEFQAALACRGRRGAMLSLPEARSVFEDNATIELLGPLDLTRPLDVMRRILDLQHARGVAAIVPVIEHGLLPAALAAARLHLPGPSVTAVNNTRDKGRMRRVLEEAGLGQVRYAACRTAAEAERFFDEVDGPIIVKPVSGSGSDGVSLVRDSAELPGALELASGALAPAGVLCEEFVEGPEVSLEGYSVDGAFVPVAFTDKLTDERFLEIGHQQPSAHPPASRAAAAAYVARALAALGMTDGVSHSELRLGARGPTLVETHTRMGGGGIHLLTRLTTGISLPDAMVAIALGEGLRPPERVSAGGAAVRFVLGRPGQLRSLEAPPLEAGDGVYAVRLHANPGQVFTGRSSSRGRLGLVVAVADEVGAAARAAQAYVDRVRTTYEGE